MSDKEQTLPAETKAAILNDANLMRVFVAEVAEHVQSKLLKFGSAFAAVLAVVGVGVFYAAFESQVKRIAEGELRPEITGLNNTIDELKKELAKVKDENAKIVVEANASMERRGTELQRTIPDTIFRHTTERVEAAVKQTTADYRFSETIIRLASLSARLEERRAFSNDEMNAAINLIEQAYSSPLFTQRTKNGDMTEFSTLVHRVVAAIASTPNNDGTIDALFGRHAEQMLLSSAIVETLAHHYGRRLVAGIYGESPRVPEYFRKVEEAARRTKLVEVVLPYRIVRDVTGESNPSRRREIFETGMKRFRFLTETEQSWAAMHMLRNRNHAFFLTEPNKYSEKLGRAFNDVGEEFDPQLADALRANPGVRRAFVDPANRITDEDFAPYLRRWITTHKL